MGLQKSSRTHDFFHLFEKFINDSRRGRRLQPNGKKISDNTIKNYGCLGRLLRKFCQEKGFGLRIREERRLNTREVAREHNYWKKFYRKFTEYLYNERGFFDNYVGLNIKNLRAFFNYLNKETSIKVGSFHKQFYVRKEEIEVFTLLPEELNFLIYDKSFESGLSKRMSEVKDVVVFGCTVALRVSDLLALNKSSVRVVNDTYYLATRSKKSNTDTLIKLPAYCVEIINKYRKLRTGLLPKFNKSNLNKYIKLLFEEAGFTHIVEVRREKRGRAVTLKNGNSKSAQYRFCDIASTHTMRRTAITTMLCLGMHEQLVRKISGHAPASKEFYRYVSWAQAYLDNESEKVYEKLKQKDLKPA